MFEQSMKGISSGNARREKTADQLGAIESGADREADFLEEIAAASKDQALAIEQII